MIQLFRNMWQRRELVKVLVAKDFFATYRQSLLGPAWAIIQPLAITFMGVVLRVVFKRSEGMWQSIIFMYSATLAWSFFGGALKAGTGAVVQGGARFPDAAGNPLGRANYLGVAGAVGVTGNAQWDYWHGVFTNRSMNDFRSITDGTSNTLMFGESAGGVDSDQDPTLFAFAWFGCGSMGTAWGLQGELWYQFNSRHPGVVQFCTADGSVRGVHLEIDLETFKALSGIEDGVVAGPGE